MRNGLYSEALELDAAAAARAAMHPAIPALQRVAAGVRASLGELRHRLLLRLSEPLTLPEATAAAPELALSPSRLAQAAGPDAVHTVGLLRRLPPPHALSEPQQRSAFLRGRAAYLDKAGRPSLIPLPPLPPVAGGRVELEASCAFGSRRPALPPEDTEPVDYLLRRLELCRVPWRGLVHAPATPLPPPLPSPSHSLLSLYCVLGQNLVEN